MKLRRILSALLAVFAGLFLFYGPILKAQDDKNSSCPCNQQGPYKATILFLNDLHGNLQPLKVKDESGKSVEVGGIARIATLVKNIRLENEKQGAKTFVIIAGDILQGTPMSTVFTGKADIEALNAIGVSAMTIGNHEFDFGLDNFLALKKSATFPIISSNVVWKDSGKLVADPYVSFQLCPRFSLNVIGATTRELLFTTAPANVEKINVLDSVKTVKESYDKLKDKGPVILLSHSRFQTDSEIATAVPGLVGIIGGHDQILFNPYRKVGEVPVFQAFEKGKYLGRIDLEIERPSGKTKIVNWTYLPVSAEIALDPEIAKIVEKYNSQLDSKFKEELGGNKTFLYGERDKIRYEETNLADWVADIMREFTGAQMAFINTGSLRASIDAGPITMEEVFKMMPYANEILMAQLTGAEVLKALTRAVSGTRDDEDGGFLAVSGIKFQIKGKAVSEVMVGDQPLDPKKTYSVAITDFMASGGDGYEMLKGKPTNSTGLPLRELIVDTIRTKKVIDAKTDGRISRL